MEIIKHGKYYKKKTCLNCDCEFSYLKKDIKSTYVNGLYGREVIRTIQCPECERYIKLWEEN